jgi:hypothetical protein
MLMVDIYARAGIFADTHALAMDAAALVKTVETVPDIPMFRRPAELNSISVRPLKKRASLPG